MPRARTTDAEDIVVEKKPRAPRTRAVSSDTAPAPRKRAPRKVAPKAAAVVEESKPEPEPEVTQTRKAPTPLAADRRHAVRSSRMLTVVVVFCMLLIGAGVTVGFFDSGAIDVIAIVNNRNEKISRGEVRDEQGNVITVPVSAQTSSPLPNGGLKMADPSSAPAPVAPVSAASTTVPGSGVGTSTASSSASVHTATSTATSTPAS